MKKYKLLTISNDEYCCCSGSKYAYQYKNEFDSKGNRILKKIAKINLYQKIQMHKQDTDIYNIIERYLGGDISKLDSNVINRGNAFYGDVSSMPDNINDFANYMNDLKRNFDLLPVDVKQKFDNSFMKFGNAVFDSSFVDVIMGDKNLVNKYNLSSNKQGIKVGESVFSKDNKNESAKLDLNNNIDGGSING